MTYDEKQKKLLKFLQIDKKKKNSSSLISVGLKNTHLNLFGVLSFYMIMFKVAVYQIVFQYII